MQNNFRVWDSNINTCPLHIARRLAWRAFQFNNINVLHHLFKYRSDITTDMKWMIGEPPDKLRSGAVRAPFFMKRLAQIIPCGLANYMIHAIAVQKLKPKKTPTEPFVEFQHNNDTRNILYIFLFYGLTTIGILIPTILQMGKCKWYDGACAALFQTRFLHNSNRQRIVYPTSTSWEAFMHNNVWPVLSDAIMKLAMQFVT